MNTLNFLKISAAFGVLSLAACQSTSSSDKREQKDLAAEGKYIAEQNCASCHTLAATGESPRMDAPPMRIILADNNPASLADDFREHIHVGHPDMPDFDFHVKEVESLLAYLASIQTGATEQ